MKKSVQLLLIFAALLVASSAMAFATPANSAALGYDFYTFASSLSSGPIGLAIAMGGVTAGGFFIFRQQVMPALGTIFGGLAVLKASSIAGSLGAIV